MNIYDISWPISPAITAYKDKNTVVFQDVKNFSEHAVRESILQMNVHSGTHVDAPSHFLEKGATIDQLSLTTMVGLCTVLDCTDVVDAMSARDLQKHIIKKNDIVLLKTKNSERQATASFDYAFVYLNADGAHYLAQQGIKAVGIDYLGIERNQPDHATHTLLMNSGITIIEGLRLADISAGNYFLCCLPIALQGTEAAPARAVLINGM